MRERTFCKKFFPAPFFKNPKRKKRNARRNDGECFFIFANFFGRGAGESLFSKKELPAIALKKSSPFHTLVL